MRAGVPDASRIRTGRSGLCCLIAGYRERINSLNSCQQDQSTSSEIDSHRVPAEAAPVCEQSTLISRIAGERAFVNNDMARPFAAMGGGVERLTADYVSIVVLPVDNDQPVQQFLLTNAGMTDDENGSMKTGPALDRTDCLRSPKFYPEGRDPPSTSSCPSTLLAQSTTRITSEDLFNYYSLFLQCEGAEDIFGLMFNNTRTCVELISRTSTSPDAPLGTTGHNTEIMLGDEGQFMARLLASTPTEGARSETLQAPAS